MEAAAVIEAAWNQAEPHQECWRLVRGVGGPLVVETLSETEHRRVQCSVGDQFVVEETWFDLILSEMISWVC